MASGVVLFDKITARLKNLSYGLCIDHCDLVLVARVCAGVTSQMALTHSIQHLLNWEQFITYQGHPRPGRGLFDFLGRVIRAEVHEDVATSQLNELATTLTANHPNSGLFHFMICLNICFVQLAERIVVSNLHKNTKKSFSETIKDMYNHFNERSGLKAPWIAADVYKIIMKVFPNFSFDKFLYQNTNQMGVLVFEIIHDWDDDYDYFGFKTLEDINYHDMLGKMVLQIPSFCMAWHGMAFDSPEAQQLNKDIFETICHHALKDSGMNYLLSAGPIFFHPHDRILQPIPTALTKPNSWKQ
ncbi:hypothetical protein AAG906_024174 [Vitis piasezkii]